MSEAKKDFPTTIGPDAVFKGQLQFEKAVNLLGKFEGEINSEGELVVAEGATLTGDVKAGTIRVDGQIKGNLQAKTKVQLTASARLEGDVQASRLEVAEGAVLVGRCMVGVNGRGQAAGAARSVSAPVSVVAPVNAKPGEWARESSDRATGSVSRQRRIGTPRRKDNKPCP
ncbi:MAG: polymer-forming cytoskeletal protein [Phycisphaerae bacterium]